MNTLDTKDVEQLLDGAYQQLKTELTAIAGVNAAIVTEFLSGQQKRAASILAGFAAGDIDAPELAALLKDQKYVLTGFLYELQIIAQVNAQELFKSTVVSIGQIILKIILPATP